MKPLCIVLPVILALGFGVWLPIEAIACAEESPTATVIVSSRETLQHAVSGARPGTRILIAPGTYEGGLSFSELRGSEDAPIVLAASDRSRPPVFKGGGSGLHFIDPSYLQICDIVVTGASGNGINIDDGGSYESPARHILLKNVQIRDIGSGGNHDGIKLSGVDDFIIEECIVQRWGEAGSAIDMVGCHRGRVVASTFRFRGGLPANGIQTKGGSSDITVSGCRFEDAGSRAMNIGGSTGTAYFRPSSAPYEARSITVEDCIFIGSEAPVAFVGVDGATVRYNTIYRPRQWVARILQESRWDRFVPCRNGVFANNLVVFRSDELSATVNVGSGTEPASFAFYGNHWYCMDKPQVSGRLLLPVEEQGGSHGEDPQFVDEAGFDLRLQPSSPVHDAGVRILPHDGE